MSKWKRRNGEKKRDKTERQIKRMKVKCLLWKQVESVGGRETEDISGRKSALVKGNVHFMTKTQALTILSPQSLTKVIIKIK